MGRVLACLKNKLLAEVFCAFFNEKLKPLWEVDFIPEPGKNYDVIVFDKASLKEFPVEAYQESKKLLLDDGISEHEAIFCFLYYKLSGILSCETTFQNLPKALEAVSKGEIWLSRGLIKKIFENYEIFNNGLPSLTSKEKEIAILVYKGFSNKEIANNLCLSLHTVKSHLNRIYQKTGVKGRNQLVKIFAKSLAVADNVNQESKRKIILKRKNHSANHRY